MNSKSLIRTSNNQVAPQMYKVDVDVLRRRIFKKEKKSRFQSRIIVAFAIISLGFISYFSV
tara:strand:+ start:292 stop:474 length:183 start_codon:yes stop_codon:yes gene_type:complete